MTRCPLWTAVPTVWIITGIASVAGGWLNDGGYLVLEAGAGQAGDIASVFAGSGWQTVGMREDLNGIKRCVILKK